MRFKYTIYSIILTATLSNLVASDLTQDPQFLDPNNRSKELKQAIDADFASVSFSTKAGAGYLFNGESKEYYFLGVNSVDELKNMIKNAPETKTEFHALDFGAGAFGWAKGTAEELQDKLPAGKTLHIYSLTGEKCGVETIEIGPIYLHNMGGIPLEFMNNKDFQDVVFKKIGGHAVKFDMIVTQFTLLHLVDPLGTFVTLMNWLPKGGLFMFDAFPVLSVHTKNEDHLDLKLTCVLNSTQEPYIMGQRFSGMPRHYILERTSETSLQLPHVYDTNNMHIKPIRHAAEKPRAHYKYLLPKDGVDSSFGRPYNLSFSFFDPHTKLKGNSFMLFDKLYARTALWKNEKTEWQSYWVGEKHPDDVREKE